MSRIKAHDAKILAVAISKRDDEKVSNGLRTRQEHSPAHATPNMRLRRREHGIAVRWNEFTEFIANV
jgi:hypothetical protein